MTLEEKVPVLGRPSIWMLNNNVGGEGLFLRLLTLVTKKLSSDNSVFVLSLQNLLLLYALVIFVCLLQQANKYLLNIFLKENTKKAKNLE